MFFSLYMTGWEYFNLLFKFAIYKITLIFYAEMLL